MEEIRCYIDGALLKHIAGPSLDDSMWKEGNKPTDLTLMECTGCHTDFKFFKADTELGFHVVQLPQRRC